MKAITKHSSNTHTGDGLGTYPMHRGMVTFVMDMTVNYLFNSKTYIQKSYSSLIDSNLQSLSIRKLE